MSESSNEQDHEQGEAQAGQEDGPGISDEQLPDELLPSEDNPLAEPLTEEEAPDDIDELDMMGSGSSDDSGDSGDSEAGDSGDSGAGDSGETSSDGESAADDDED